MTLRERLFGRKVWKVTDYDGRSVIARSDARVQYGLGLWTTAPTYLAERGYHPLAFDSESAAQLFAEPGEQVFEARATGFIEPLPPMLGLSAERIGSIDQAIRWAEDRGSMRWPKGSVMAKRIMLIKRVA